MDAEPERREINMARWTFAGSLGVVLGPLALGLVVQIGGGWRQVFALFGIFALALWFFARRLNFSRLESGDAPPESLSDFFSMLRATLGALRSGTVLRWLALLEFSDLMLDVLLGFLALYMVDVAGVGLAQAGVAVAVWTGAGLLGDFLLIPLLEKMSGLAYLRLSACLEFGLYIAFLLTPYGWAKLAVLALLGFFNSGWYAILQAQLYKALPGRSGAAMAANSIAGLVGGLIPLGLGWVAQRYNLQMSMWLLLSGPIALILGLWRVKYFQQGEINTEDLDD
jgi:FSR family fosmidomycin resistance protein-like MFS transporter